MAGIFGYLSQEIDKISLDNMVRIINDQGYCVTHSILNRSCVLGKLGFESSKVNELTERTDRLSIVTCGEIYNEDIEDLDKSILTLYETGDLDRLKDLNGSFASAIYDRTEDKLTLVNDRYGLIKLFYYHDENHFCFSPKIRPLLVDESDKSLRKDAIIDFFLFGYLLGDKTFFKRIHQLPPASVLEVSKNNMKLTKYWDYEYDEEYDARPQEELIDELGALWQRAVERRIKRDETVIIPLSGGLDSRAILAAALRCTSKDNIITFTFGDPGSFDFEIGRMVAEKAGVKNVPFGVEKKDFEGQYNISMDDIEGMVDATPYFAIRGYEEMEEYGTHILSGYIGDFIMGSHMFPEMIKTNLITDNECEKASNLILEKDLLHTLNDIKNLLSHSICKKMDNPISKEELKKNKNKNLSNIYFKHFLENHTDKYSYFTVFRYRSFFNYSSPFLDNDLVDFMRRISPKLRFGQKLYTSMLSKKYPELFKLPTKTNQGLRLDADNISLFLNRAILLSKMMANRILGMLIKRNIFLDKGKNYIDYDELIGKDKEYRDYMRKMIEKVKEREYFNKDYIEDIWRLQIQGKKNYAMLFGLLVTFELFLEGFVDD